MLNKIGDEIIEKFKEKLKNEDLVVTGKLLNSIHYIVSKNKIDIYGAEYAKFIDSGTKPHFINKEGVESIKKWASIRNINPWAVITKIRKYGTKPHHYLDSFNSEIDKIVKQNLYSYIEFETKKVYENLRNMWNKQSI